MARKNVIDNYKFFDGLTLDANLNSGITNVLTTDNIGIHLNWTGTPVGEFFVQGANEDLDDLKRSGKNWVNLTFTEGAIIGGGDVGNHLLVIKQFPFKYMRMTYAFTSSSGVVNAILTAKQVGG